MHDALKSSSGYHKELDEALNDEFLRRTLDTFAVAYRANREAVFKEVDEKALIKQIADAKDYACQHMDELYAQFKAEAEKRGVHVHRAATAEEANDLIVRIAKENKVKKSSFLESYLFFSSSSLRPISTAFIGLIFIQ